jgi:hypothetical protein
MNFHEYQAKQLFADYGIAVPAGRVARSPNEAVDAAKAIGGDFWVVKAQIHAGGRGKAGGVKLQQVLRRSARIRQGHARHEDGDLPVGRRRAAGGFGAGDPGHRHRPGAVPVGSGRPLHAVDHLHRLRRRWRGDREDRGRQPRRDQDPQRELRAGPAAVPVPRHGLRAGPQRQAGRPAHQDHAGPVQAVQREGPGAGRTEPARDPHRRRPARARRQDQFRRQRQLPPSRAGGDARHQAGRRDRSAGQQVRPQLRHHGRQHRLHGQWRRPGDGHDGRDQAERRRAGELPRCRRRRQQGDASPRPSS